MIDYGSWFVNYTISFISIGNAYADISIISGDRSSQTVIEAVDLGQTVFSETHITSEDIPYNPFILLEISMHTTYYPVDFFGKPEGTTGANPIWNSLTPHTNYLGVIE